MRWYFSLLMVAVLVISGCSVYTFNPKGQSDLQTIALLPFENRTDQYELTDRLTEIIIDAFIADGNLKVVSEANADAVLEGVLSRYRRVAYKFDENDQVQQYKVVMDFDISLKDPAKDALLWRETMEQEGIYDAVTETEEIGQERAGALLVEAILNKSTKSW